MAISASAMPGATTTSDAEPWAPMLRNELITPHTVPISPMKGETLPVVARNPTCRSRFATSSLAARSMARWATS